jgi:hypothetical protein
VAELENRVGISNEVRLQRLGHNGERKRYDFDDGENNSHGERP